MGVRSTSSSSIVSVTASGFLATPWLLAAVAEIDTSLSLGASSSSFTAATVTAPVLAIAPAAMVSTAFALRLKSEAAVCIPADAVTVRVVAALDACESVAVTVASPPFSEIDDEDRTSVTEGAASSSRIVSVTLAGAATPLFPLTVADTVTCLSGASVELLTAVTVTVPVLVVAPAAMVSVFVLDKLKSPASALVPAVAATVSVTASLDARFSVAVTVLDPGFVPSCSSIVAGLSTSVAVGAASSSRIVSVTLAGAATPLFPLTAAETVTCLSGALIMSLTAVIVTVPVLLVAPATMVSVFVLDKLKSDAAAFVPAAAATVSVTASLDARFSVAVTVLDPGFVPSCSSIVAGLSASVAVGVASSSVSVSAAPFTAPTPRLFCAVPLTVVVRLTTLSMASSTAVIVTLSAVFVVLPAAIVTVASDPTV